MYGLNSLELQVIVDAIKKHPEVDEALLFGSRALNTHRKGSDIDIALKGKNIGTVVTQISGWLNEESPLPYVLDILDYNAITNPDLQDHIDRVGKSIYKKI